MKIILLYVYIVKQSEGVAPDYGPIHHRFISTYNQFKPGIPHDIVVVAYGGDPKPNDYALIKCIDGMTPGVFPYYGGGFDCGAYQTAANLFDCDMMVCCNTQVHFHQYGWLERLAETWNGSLTGPMGSFENNPHLRTPCIAVHPALLRAYPHVVNGRHASYPFESGPTNLTRFAQMRGAEPLMITWDGVYKRVDWRRPNNIFRRGNGSNLLLHDKHSKLWLEMPDSDPMKRKLQRSADGFKV